MRKTILQSSRILAELSPELHPVVEFILRRAGFSHFQNVSDRRQVLSVYHEYRPDLFILDCTVPQLDPLALLKQFRSHITEAEYLPILAVTSNRTRKAHEAALSLGAKDLICRPFEYTEFILRVNNLLETRWVHQQQEIVVQERTQRLIDAQQELLRCLEVVADQRDGLGGQHGRRVGRIAGLVAERVGVPLDEARQIAAAAALHDIGKVGVPDYLLTKTGRLEAGEYEILKTHTTIGAKILSGFNFPILQVAQVVARYHHERWDGKGYEGLKGDEIPLAARITALADACDVMLSGRPYQDAMSVADLVAEIRKQRGRHFDPDLVNAFVDLLSSDLATLNRALMADAEPFPSEIVLPPAFLAAQLAEEA